MISCTLAVVAVVVVTAVAVVNIGLVMHVAAHWSPVMAVPETPSVPPAAPASTAAPPSCRRHRGSTVPGTADTPAGRRCIWSWRSGSSHTSGRSVSPCRGSWKRRQRLLIHWCHPVAPNRTPDQDGRSWHNRPPAGHHIAPCARGRPDIPLCAVRIAELRRSARTYDAIRCVCAVRAMRRRG